MTSPALKESAAKMDAAVDHVLKDFAGLNTGKANPAMVETIRFAAESYGGATMAIKDVAAVSTPDARTIVIQPWDKGLLKEIEKGITNANLGFNPRADSEKILISIPTLTAERRAELTKVAGKMAEEGKVVLRNIRHDALDAIRKQQKASTITEDDLKRLEKELQTLTDDHTKKVDEALEKKEKELTTV
jgi:ribosome recycling factor